MISERISDDIPPQMKKLNMAIPILMRFYSLVSNWSVASRTETYVIQQNVTYLMTSNYFQQNIAGYTVANFGHHPIRRRVTEASALELTIISKAERQH